MREQELRDRLGAVDVPPSRLDVGNVLAAGRRADRRRTVQIAGGTVLVMGALVALPSVVFGARGTPTATPLPSESESAMPLPPGDCRLADLPAPPGMARLAPDAVDPTGRYIVGTNVSGESGPKAANDRHTRAADTQPVLWTDGRAQALPAPARAMRAAGVNADGVVVALSGETEMDTVWRYVDGVPQKLSTPGGTWVFDFAQVNAAGDIAASGTTGALFWKAGSAKATAVSKLPGTELRALLDDGTMIGHVASADRLKITAYTWTPSGRPTKLTAPGGEDVEIFTARGDWVTARVVATGAAIRWNRKTGARDDLNLPFPPNGINARGWIVSQNVLTKDTGPVGLAGAPGDFASPFAIADNGLIAGIRTPQPSANSEPSPAASTPTGEPAYQPITWTCR